jgi:hypothetical protein
MARTWLFLALIVPVVSGFAGSNTRFASGVHVRSGGVSAAAASAVPAELSGAAWLPELQACCSVSAATSPEQTGEARMGILLEWLQKMLVQLELGDVEDEEDDELDSDFVNAARPWLHTKAFFDIPAQDFAQTIWSHVSAADYLQAGGSGGSLLLLVPSRLPLSLFEQVTETVASGVATHVNSAAVVTGCHPDAARAEQRSPVPVVQIFLDSPDLLIDGGSMSDAAGFL